MVLGVLCILVAALAGGWLGGLLSEWYWWQRHPAYPGPQPGPSQAVSQAPSQYTRDWLEARQALDREYPDK